MITILVIIFVITTLLSVLLDHDKFMALGLMSFISSVFSGGALLVVTIYYIHAVKKADYLKRKYNIEYSREDIFWNESLVDYDLRAKGIIIDGSQKFNVDLNNE